MPSALRSRARPRSRESAIAWIRFAADFSPWRSRASTWSTPACRGRDVLYQARVHELLDDPLAEVLDVHRPARAEVAQALLELRREALFMQRQYASPRGGRRRHALGAPRRERVRRARRALGRHDLDDVGDHVAGALDQHGVADADVLLPDLVLVVEAHVADHDAGELDGWSLATGVRMPVLPTPTSIASTTVVACRAANLNAIASGDGGWSSRGGAGSRARPP